MPRETQARRMALAFLESSVESSADTVYATAAAARFALLQVPDKAEIRGYAVTSVAEVVRPARCPRPAMLSSSLPLPLLPT